MWPTRSTVLRVTNPAVYPEESLRIQTACPSASYMGNAVFLGTGSMEAETQRTTNAGHLANTGEKCPKLRRHLEKFRRQRKI